MPGPDRTRPAANPRLGPHRRRVFDIVLLAAALVLVHVFISPVTAPAALTFLVAAGLLAADGRARGSALATVAARLPSQLAVFALSAAAGYYFFGLAVRFLWFGAIWIALILTAEVLPRIPWRLLGSGARIGARLAARISLAGYRRLQRAARDRDDLALGEAMVWAVLAYLAASLSPDFWPRPWLPWAAVVAWIALRAVALWHRPAATWQLDLLRLIGCFGVFAAALAVAKGALGGHWLRVDTTALAWAFIFLAALRLAARRLRFDAAETLRWMALVGLSLFLLRGLARFTLHGTPDAEWYATMLADAIAQLRAGVFPLWVGQSVYQFNGAIYPLRIAPAFHYLGGALDALTLHALGVFAVQNLLLIACGLATTLSAYLCLGALLPGRRTMAAALALLFLGCPGVLGLAYNTDLFMSWTTLPWVPLAWFATIRSFRDRGAPVTLLILGASLGLCWWGHTPIAMWSTGIAGVIQWVRLAAQPPRSAREAVPLAIGALAFAAVAAYPIGSVLAYPPIPGLKADDFQKASAGTVAYFLGQAFPASLLPLSATGRALGDFQLGYGLWVLLLGALASLLMRGRRLDAAAPLLAAVALAVLMIPGSLALRLWTAVPAVLRDTTGNWVMNRLYVPFAGAIVFGTAASFRSGPYSERRLRSGIAWIVAAACVWAVFDDAKFGFGSRQWSFPPESAAGRMRTENVKITRFAYLVFPAWPDSFTHGVADPALQNDLLDPKNFAIVASNEQAARAAGKSLLQVEFKPDPKLPNALTVARTIRIVPGQRYLFDFQFLKPEVTGVLQILGRDLLREYGLPEYGGATSFGAGGRHSHLLSIWTGAHGPEDLKVRFVLPGPLAAATMPFGSVNIFSFDPASLPIRVTSWIPYRAEVTSPQDAWLRTPRMYQRGYHATVNGTETQVRTSPDGLACIAVPAGNSRVELVYRPPAGLLALFWLSALAIIAGVGCAASHLLQTERRHGVPEGTKPSGLLRR